MYLLTLFAIYLFAVFSFFYVGHIFKQMLLTSHKDGYNHINEIFKTLLIGVTSSTILFAIIWSYGTSILAIALAVFVMYMYIKKKRIKYSFFLSFHIDYKLLFYCLGALIIAFAHLALYAFNFQNDFVDVVYQDYHFYSEISRGLIFAHIENPLNRIFDFNIPENSVFYHFFDGWTTALISLISRINTFDVMLMVVYPLFTLLTYLGVASLISIRFKSKIAISYYSLILLFGISLFFINKSIHPIVNYHGFGLLPFGYNSLKLLYTFPFVLYGLRFLLEKKYLEFYVIILITSITYNTLFIWISCGIIISGIAFIKQKKNFKYEIIHILNISIFTAVLVVLYKVLFVKQGAVIEINELSIPLKTYLIIYVEHIFRFFISNLPVVLAFVAAILLSKEKQNKFTVNFFLLFFGGGFLTTVLAITITHGTMNFAQALMNFVPQFSLSIAILAFIYMPKKILHFFSIFFLLISTLNIFMIITTENHRKVYDIKYQKQVLKLITHNDKYLIYNTNDCQDWHYCFLELAPFTSKLYSNSSAFNICHKHIKNDNLANMKSPYITWLKKNKRIQDTENLRRYLIENKIKYLFSNDEHSLPNELLKDYTLLIQDDKSRECFYVNNKMKCSEIIE